MKSKQPNNFIPLEEIQIAKPCRADWDKMTGDERARFCGSCHKNVYDISQMTRAQAQQLIQEKEGNVCLRLHRRPDGTVITSDCPVGIAATPRPLWLAVAVLALLSSGLAGCGTQSQQTMGDIAAVPALDDSNAEVRPTVQPAPTEAATPATQLGQIQPAPTSEPVATENHLSSVTLGAPMMPNPKATPKSAPTPQPTNAPIMGKPTMGQPQISSAAVEADMGIMAPICQKPQ